MTCLLKADFIEVNNCLEAEFELFENEETVLVEYQIVYARTASFINFHRSRKYQSPLILIPQRPPKVIV